MSTKIIQTKELREYVSDEILTEDLTVDFFFEALARSGFSGEAQFRIYTQREKPPFTTKLIFLEWREV